MHCLQTLSASKRLKIVYKALNLAFYICMLTTMKNKYLTKLAITQNDKNCMIHDMANMISRKVLL